MSFSLNEVEATAKRAARGAGYSWGLAEEASKATRWLCERGVDGCVELARLLDANLASAPVEHAPQSLDSPWQASGPLCPLATGAALSDSVAGWKAAPLELRNVAVPALLLPFAAMAARQIGGCLSVSTGDQKAMTDGIDLEMNPAFSLPNADVTVSSGGEITKACACSARATPDPEAWATLNRFAHRTFAPATEESRLLGAGAGLSDND